MKYTEKIGEVETIYEGTPSEIMELYIKMNPEEPGIDLKDLVAEDIKVKERYDNMEHFDLMPNGAILNKKYKATGIGNLPSGEYSPCQPINIKPTNPMIEPNITINCGTNMDKIAEEIGTKMANKIALAVNKI